ncbi:Uncharacterized conserved protein, DUF885 family [Erythrobacter litoralis]|jgi:uncharacterized protein (DUF885 family)|uniref:Lipoprotein n=1 Tax=Erythrobacter litoralis TaxID=39960 RepID=A0A074NFZ5_9SPHN|nr:DUF885 domain-containing protein [Erythrobacter litoralis]AOL25024.1 Uncharacterized conserved protein, DUF885 family [Erythrobacter litoralis]KEO96547.1 hypothetical protein EH32_09975 [Erythrobacter litoralis]MEE4337575.1 DUF885 domain-containing protein [Erythrobacter sp.]
MLRTSLLAASAIALASAGAPVLAQDAASGGTPVSATAADDAWTAIADAETIGDLFEAYDEAQLAMSPAIKAYRGIRDEDYGRWGEVSDEAERREALMLLYAAAQMRAKFDPAALDEQDALSYRLFDLTAQRSAMLWPYRELGYVFDQRSGPHTRIPAFLINIHRVGSAEDAKAYVSRIAGMGEQLDAYAAEARERAEAGVMPPDWTYPYMISDVEGLIAAGDDNAVLEDFGKKIAALDLDADTKAQMKAEAAAAWNDNALPSYRRLLAELKRQQPMAPTDDGVWRLPNGEAYYAALLKNYTTTDLSADEIHEIGLRQVERIHGEMRAIMDQVGFEGSLQDFFEYTRSDERFYYDTREAYLADAQARLDALEAKLPQYFGRLPQADMIIKPVEAFREKSAGKAFYQSPAPDGSRPGTYYVNLYNLNDMSKNELEALAYHEGMPGHHLQRALQTELGDMPPFRRFGGWTAYTEGWGLYSEELGKDMGFYEDPYSDFGRLGMELWRACRLVVDTGIHSKKWSREEAIQYLRDNTPNPEGDIVKAIERYVVYPGQATAYMIGKLKIMELRDMAMRELGDDFDYRGFHDTVLLSGPVPLSILEENVGKWVADQKRGG